MLVRKIKCGKTNSLTRKIKLFWNSLMGCYVYVYVIILYKDLFYFYSFQISQLLLLNMKNFGKKKGSIKKPDWRN